MKRSPMKITKNYPLFSFHLISLMDAAGGLVFALHELIYAMLNLEHIMNVDNAGYIFSVSLYYTLLNYKMIVHYYVSGEALSISKWNKVTLIILLGIPFITSIFSATLFNEQFIFSLAVVITQSAMTFFPSYLLRQWRKDDMGEKIINTNASPPYIERYESLPPYEQDKSSPKTNINAEFISILDEIILSDRGYR